MRIAVKPRDIPGRAVLGAYILHSGLGKWSLPEDRAAGVHGMAADAFEVLKPIPPRQFTKLLSAVEIATGAVLLTPVVPTALAGLAVTAFSGGLVAMYLRTPSMHQPGSVWPTAAGTGISKDSWMLAMGLAFLVDGIGRSKRERRRVVRAVGRAAKAGVVADGA